MLRQLHHEEVEQSVGYHMDVLRAAFQDGEHRRRLLRVVENVNCFGCTSNVCEYSKKLVNATVIQHYFCLLDSFKILLYLIYLHTHLWKGQVALTIDQKLSLLSGSKRQNSFREQFYYIRASLIFWHGILL